MEFDSIELKNVDSSWLSSELLRFLEQESLRAKGTVLHKETTQVAGVKDSTIITSIVLSIASSVCYDLIKYGIAKLSPKHKNEVNLEIVINGKQVSIKELRK